MGGNEHWSRHTGTKVGQGQVVTPLRGSRQDEYIAVREPGDFLRQFLWLAKAKRGDHRVLDERVAEFVSLYGALGLCPIHSLPASASIHGLGGSSPGCFHSLDRVLREPVETYFHISAQFAKAGVIASNLDRRSQARKHDPRRRYRTHPDYDAITPHAPPSQQFATPPLDWLVFADLMPDLNSLVEGVAESERLQGQQPGSQRWELDSERRILATVLKAMIDRAGIRLTVVWAGTPRPELTATAGGPLAVLTLRLVGQVTRVDRDRICEECNEIFQQSGGGPRSKFCDGCRARATSRERTARYRQRHRKSPEGAAT